MDQEEDVATWEGEIQDLEGKLMELRQEMDGVKESIKEKAVVLTAQNDKLEDHDIKVQEIMSRIQEMRAKLKVCVYICECIICTVYVHVYVCIHMYMYVHVYLCMYMSMYVCTCVFVYVHVYVCMYMCICVCM